MPARSRRRLVVILLAVAALLGLLLLLWWKKGRPIPRVPLTATLEAPVRLTSAQGHLGVHAVVIMPPGTDEEERRRLVYAWSATSGHVRGRGADATWVAGGDPGPATISLEVSHPGGTRATASIELAVREPSSLSAVVENENNMALAGYEIKSVKFDKPEICDDDDVKVTIEATDPDGSSAWLEPTVQFGDESFPGFETIARVGYAYRDFPARFPPDREVTVILRDMRLGREVARKTVKYPIKRCDTDTGGVVLFCDAAQVDASQVECEVRLVRHEGFVPVHYEWEVGIETGALDPPSATATETPRARLPFPRRVQDAKFHMYLARVRVSDASGKTLEGRTALLAPNPMWEHTELNGELRIMVKGGFAPMPSAKDGNVLELRGQVENVYGEPIRITGARLVHATCADKRTAIEDGQASIPGLFGGDVIPPAGQLSFVFTRPSDMRRCIASVFLTGEGVKSGLPAKGQIDMITDPALNKPMSEKATEWTAEAMRVLGERKGERVSEMTWNEVDELIREGALPPPPEPIPGVTATGPEPPKPVVLRRNSPIPAP